MQKAGRNGKCKNGDAASARSSSAGHTPSPTDEHSRAPAKPLRILLTALEFPTWERARALGYIGQLGIEEGLAANGVEFVTLPAVKDCAASWLDHAESICGGAAFDQAWIEIVHSDLSERFLQWLTGVAPVRIAFQMESLDYDAETLALLPHLRGRRDHVERRLRYMTHLVAVDEKDVDDFDRRGFIPTMWWAAGGIPARTIVEASNPPVHRCGMFSGSVYGERGAWLDRPDLRGLLLKSPSSEDGTPYPALFDELIRRGVTTLQTAEAVDASLLRSFLNPLRTIRRDTFALWLEMLQTGAAVVNLPQAGKAYASRVHEGMAAGRPVITFEVPDRPRTKALFRDGEEILLYRKDDPAALARQVRRVLEEPGFAERVAANARAKMLRHHTLEHRVRQILDWVATGAQPDFGENAAPAPDAAASLPSAKSLSTVATPEKSTPGALPIDDFYVDLFVKNPHYSTPYPNSDEASRWARLQMFLSQLPKGPHGLRILDLGCGRGWMTNLASVYGTCEGVDPVVPVIEQARRNFPHLRFHAGSIDTVLALPDFQPYDVVISSEVLEHIPRPDQPEFARGIGRLLKPGGFAIISTPRGEAFEEWRRLQNADQPVEDWLREDELLELFGGVGFRSVGQDRVYFDKAHMNFAPVISPEHQQAGPQLPIYQVWAFQAIGSFERVQPAAAPARRIVAVSHHAPDEPPAVSFCIITAGQRPTMLDTVIRSIHAQRAPLYEIIVSGRHHDAPGLSYVACEEAAANGRLGRMRNLAVEHAQYDNIVILDDDIVLAPDWYARFCAGPIDFDIQTSQVRVPDGGRYWDHATFGGPRGHWLLEPDETDEFVYMTGGGGWVMKRKVAERVRWDEGRGFYNGEDVDFARRCQAAGFTIRHRHECLVYHVDSRYTSIGRGIAIRDVHPDASWVERELALLDANGTLERALMLLRDGHNADGADALRYGLSRYPDDPGLSHWWARLVDGYGGELSGARWHPAGDPAYRDAMAAYGAAVNDQASRTTDHASRLTPALTWNACLFNYSGYARAAREMVAALDRAGLRQRVEQNGEDDRFVDALRADSAHCAYWQRLLDARHGDTLVAMGQPVHWNGTDWFGLLRDHYRAQSNHFGITMFETDRIPAGWAQSCNAMNEVWVPSRFNYETFRAAGVREDRLRVVPLGIDLGVYDPATVQPRELPDCAAFTFLSVFQWTLRKGWDVLLRAYLEAFDRTDDVCLLIRSHGDHSDDTPIRQRIDAFVRSLGRNPKEAPRIVTLDEFVTDAEMPALYRAADCFVLPTRGEGWGLPFVEAMALGLPTIGTRWSAHLDFMTDENSYLIDQDGLTPVPPEQTAANPYYGADHLWAAPSVRHTAELMRKVFDHRQEAAERGARARADVVASWSADAAASAAIDALRNPLRRPSRPAPATVPARSPASRAAGASSDTTDLTWHAPVFNVCGYSDEARQFLRAVERTGLRPAVLAARWNERVAVLPEIEERRLLAMTQRRARPGGVHISHALAPAFSRREDAAANIGRTMFESDRLPDGWAECCARMDRIWVPSEFNLETFARAGVPESKLAVVPGLIDLADYPLDVQPLRIDGVRGFNFLSIFDWSLRKGWDVLLRAYVEEFSPDEDVALILKTHSYSGLTIQEIGERIVAYVRDSLRCDPDRIPDIVLQEVDLPAHGMPALYRAADCFVLPTRGEGWGRPLMEAMAMALPTIGTRWSGCTAFMDTHNSLPIDCEVVAVSDDAARETPTFTGHRWAEPDVVHLRVLMRRVFEDREEAKAIGLRARRDIAERFSHEQVAPVLLAELRAAGLDVPEDAAAAEGSVAGRRSAAVDERLACA